MPHFPLALLAASGLALPAQIVTLIVGFLIVLAVLHKFAWTGVLKAIDERREHIRGQFDQIDRRQSDLNTRIKEYEERLRQIDEEANRRLTAAVDEGRRISEELAARARTEADAMMERARTTIQIETDKAKVELRDHTVALAIGAAEKLLHKELNDNAHRELVGSFVEELNRS